MRITYEKPKHMLVYIRESGDVMSLARWRQRCEEDGVPDEECMRRLDHCEVIPIHQQRVLDNGVYMYVGSDFDHQNRYFVQWEEVEGYGGYVPEVVDIHYGHHDE